MIHARVRWFAAAAVAVVVPLVAAAAPRQDAAAQRPIEIADMAAYNAIGATALSDDGQWFAHREGPVEGDGHVVVRNTTTGRELTFPAGQPPRAAGNPGAQNGGAALAFSAGSKWLAFITYPSHAESKRLERQKRPLRNGLTLVDLSNGHPTDYGRVRRFEFSGESGAWIAMYRYRPDTPGANASRDTGGGRAARHEPRGADLVLRELASGHDENIGNVADFTFTKDGRRLAFTIDAQDEVGNGIQVRDMQAGTVAVLDSGQASYEHPAWSEHGDALAVLKGTEDRNHRDTRYAVLGYKGIGADRPKAVSYDPASDEAFPRGMAISPDRDPRWTDDQQAILFGIHDAPPAEADVARPEGAGADREPPADSSGANDDDKDDKDDKVDLVLWHWKDKRLQTEQGVEEARDRAFSFLAEYRVESRRFIRLADDSVRTVRVTPRDRYAIGIDAESYEPMSNLDGRHYEDIYAIDLATGARKPAVKHVRWFDGPSPDGRSFLYYDGGNYYVYSLDTMTARNITAAAPVSFVDVEDDHNIVEPPIDPVGWASDSRAVLLSDAWDVWKVPVEAGQSVNLTVNGRKDRIRYARRFALERPEDRDKGIDLHAPQYFSAYGEWTKKGGIARVDPGKPGVTLVAWGDSAFSRLMKAQKADRFVYTHETATDPEDYFVTGAAFTPGTRLTDQRPALAPFAWSSGSMLVNYTSDKGDKLQAALFLPAHYQKGRAYPTVVQIYEHLSQGANTFGTLGTNGFSRALYTSHGYAVLQPDITYRVNDPGMSAVWCVVPAVKAAIATGVVDAKHVGLTGHSWGGYQTAFLVTQTDIFAAAVAGAPLTDMVSMSSLVYKNTGGANEAIFESSQGRFKGGYWDNWDAYYRNSPVFFARNVHTPLMILHNDKDGAVDFTQGVEYFNTLRRLQKPVIMLEYLGENHGLRKPANMRDYTARMMDFFDHYLKGMPAPDWMVNGVPRLKMEDHLKAYTKEKQGQGSPM